MFRWIGPSLRRTAGATALACFVAVPPATAAQDRPLTADFPEVYRAGGLNAPDWAQFQGRGPTGFDAVGNLYVLDYGASQVVVIDPQGSLVRTVGREGEGPGEFGLAIQLAVWPDGRFAVSEVPRRAIHVFGSGGQFVRTLQRADYDGTLLQIRADPNGDALYAQGSSRSGTQALAALNELLGRESLQEGVDDFGIGRIDLGADEFAVDPVLQAWRAPRADASEDDPEELSLNDLLDQSRMRSSMARARMAGPLLEPRLRWDILPDGTIAYSDSSAYAVKLVRAGVPEVDVLRRPIEPERVTGRLRSAAIDRDIRLNESFFEDASGLPDDVREWIEQRAIYPEVQIIRAIRATWQGGLWIRRPGEEPWDTQGPIDVFGSDRQYIGTLLDSDGMPDAFGPDGLVAYWEVDEMDVPTIVVKRLSVEVR